MTVLATSSEPLPRLKLVSVLPCFCSTGRLPVNWKSGKSGAERCRDRVNNGRQRQGTAGTSETEKRQKRQERSRDRGNNGVQGRVRTGKASGNVNQEMSKETCSSVNTFINSPCSAVSNQESVSNQMQETARNQEQETASNQMQETSSNRCRRVL